MPDYFKDLALGIFIGFLALIMWRVEHNIWAWLIFFVASAFYIVLGFIKGLRK
jgi:hypothetical protein